MYRLKNFITLLILLLASSKMGAQIFPISNNFYIQAGSSPVMSDWYNSINPKLNIVLQNKDYQRNQINCRLWIRIEGSNGEVLETKQNYSAPNPITLFSGQIQTLGGDDIAPYLAPQNMNMSGFDVQKYLKDGTLPEGNYIIRIIVFNWNSTEQLSVESTTMGFFNLSDPPLLTQPMDGTAVQALNPQSILFGWSPRHSPLPDNSPVEYKFELWEVLQNRNPQEVALYQQPIQTLTTYSLNQMYDISHTNLDTGKTYAWRVRAQTSNGKGYFRNNGYSEVYSFKYLSPNAMPYTDAPTDFELMRTNLTNAEFKWNTDARYQSYRLEYRVKNGDRWIATKTTTGEGIADQLEPDREYQAKVQGYNATADIYGFYSKMIDFKTPKVPVFKCGETPDNKPLPTRPPLARAHKGDVFKMGGYNLYCTNVTGGGGTFSGEGIVNVPFLIQILSGKAVIQKPEEALKTGFAVVFNSIAVDDDYNVVSGKVNVVTKGWKSMMTEVMDNSYNASVGKVKTGAPEISGKVDFSLAGVSKAESVKEIKDSTGKVVGSSIKIKDPATGKETEIKAEKMPATVQDKNGNVYSVDKDGTIKSVGEPNLNFPNESEANIIADASKGSVKWENIKEGNNKSNYFIDDQTNSTIATAFADKYKVGILTSGTETKYAPWKAIGDGTSESIQATVSITDPTLIKDSVIFITGKGLKYVATTSDKKVYTLLLSAPPAGDMQELYCRVKDVQGKWQTIGKLLVEAFPKRERLVILVPIAGATIDDPTKNNLKTELNKIYNGANAYWDVQVSKPLDISSLGLSSITVESKLFPCYSPEMRKINTLLKSDKEIYSTNDKISYVFVVGSGIQKPTGVDGEMPRGKQFGYIFGTPTANLLAHELGHGQYKFKHTFSEIPALAEGTTSPKNLEDYTPGTNLFKYQWDQIHFPLQDEFVCLDSDEEGQVNRLTHLAIAPNGKIMDDFYMNNKEVVPKLHISNNSYYIGSISYNDKVYTWNSQGHFENGNEKITFKRNSMPTSQVNIIKPHIDNCKYQYITIDWKSEDELSENLKVRIEARIPKDAHWIGYPYSDSKIACVNQFADEIKSLNNSCQVVMVETHKATLLKEKLNPGAIHLTSIVNSSCLDAIRSLSFEDIMLYFNKISNQEEIKEKSEVALLRLMSAMKSTDYSKFYWYLATNSTYKKLNHLISEIHDIGMLGTGDNFKNFSSALLFMYNNSNPPLWTQDKVKDEHIVVLEGQFKDTAYIGIYGAKNKDGFRHECAYDLDKNQLTIHFVPLKTTYSTTTGFGSTHQSTPVEVVSTNIKPFEPIVIATIDNLDLVATALEEAKIGMENTYVVPAFFFEYIRQKKFNENVKKGAQLTADILTITASGPIALSSKVNIFWRVHAAAEVVGATMDIALISSDIQGGKIYEATNIFNGAMGLIGFKNGVKALYQISKNIPNAIKTNQSIRAAVLAAYLNWKVAIAKLPDISESAKTAILKGENVIIVSDKLSDADKTALVEQGKTWRFLRAGEGVQGAGKVVNRTLDAASDLKIIDRVKTLRKKLTSALKKSGNFGWAEAEVSGLSKSEYYAHSSINEFGNSDLVNRVPEISLKPEKEIFPWTSEPNNLGGMVDRNIDTEYKILTEIAEKLGGNTNATGKIRLFTERAPCNSCSNVIELFSKKYQKIEIEVIHNNGNMLIDF